MNFRSSKSGLSPRFRSLEKLWLQLPIGLLQALGDDFGVIENRHKIGVAVPAGDDVEMKVAVDPSSSGAPQIHTQIETVRLHNNPKRSECFFDQFPKLKSLLLGELTQLSNVPVGSDQQMPRVVRKEVEHRKATLPSPQDQILLILVLAGFFAEDAFSVIWPQPSNIFHSPWRPKSLHLSPL